MFRLIGSSFLFGFVVLAGPVNQIVPLTQVFVPQVGYNDNNNVEIVVQGDLPNPCFTPSRTRVEHPSENTFHLSQTAWLRKSGACSSGYSEDDPVPFHEVVSLGFLPGGSYRIEFEKEDGAMAAVRFDVASATNEKVDEHDYAVIRSIDMRELFMPGSRVEATIRGFTTSTCLRFGQDPQVQVIGNVVVVLPILTRAAGQQCVHERREFRKSLNLSMLGPGSYLLHVRSRNGKGVYQPFDVLKEYGTRIALNNR